MPKKESVPSSTNGRPPGRIADVAFTCGHDLRSATDHYARGAAARTGRRQRLGPRDGGAVDRARILDLRRRVPAGRRHDDGAVDRGRPPDDRTAGGVRTKPGLIPTKFLHLARPTRSAVFSPRASSAAKNNTGSFLM